jgi:hypothetical protein
MTDAEHVGFLGRALHRVTVPVADIVPDVDVVEVSIKLHDVDRRLVVKGTNARVILPSGHRRARPATPRQQEIFRTAYSMFAWLCSVQV